MGRRPFIRKKSNSTKNKEAFDVFKLHNALAPTTRNQYISLVNQFADFLLLQKKSLWDATHFTVKEFLSQNATFTNGRSAIQTFYRVLSDANEYTRENPVTLLKKLEASEQVVIKPEIPIEPVHAEQILATLAPEATVVEVAVPEKKRRRRRKVSESEAKPLLTINDLDQLVKRTRHIRERAVLEVLYATGAKLTEIVNLNVSDVDIEGKRILFFETNMSVSRGVAIPKRTLAFLKVYERWRFRQLSPSSAYFISKRKNDRLAVSTISAWLNRVQKWKKLEQRWVASDFRKRAVLHHYWLTKDLSGTTRYGGFKNPETTLRTVNHFLIERGIETIEDLTKLPEFAGIRREQRKVVPLANNSTTITVSLDPDELEILRKSGLSPTQAVRTIFSLKDLYSTVTSLGGGIPSSSIIAPRGTSKGGPITGGSGSIGKNSSSLPAGSLPNLNAKSSDSPIKSFSSAQKPPQQPVAKLNLDRNPTSFLNELKLKLQKRKQAEQAKIKGGESETVQATSLGSKVFTSTKDNRKQVIVTKEKNKQPTITQPRNLTKPTFGKTNSEFPVKEKE